MDLVIKEDTLKKAAMSGEELLIEMAAHLYDAGRLTMGQARTLAQLDHISFQKELSKRDIYIKYDIEDLETDLRNLQVLELNKK